MSSAMRFPKEEYQQRWRRLDEKLAASGYEAVVIWQRSGGSYDRAGNVYYYTGYASQASGQEGSALDGSIGASFAAMLFRRGCEPELHVAEKLSTVDRRYLAVDEIHDDLFAGTQALAARLEALGVEGRVAYVGDDFVPGAMLRELAEATPAIEWCAEDELLFRLLGHKSERELALYREAGEIATRALTAFVQALIRGERQCDAAAEAASILIRAGGGSHRLGCNTGPPMEHSMWDKPLYGYSTRAAEPGEMLRAWIYGPLLEGYWMDPGRTAVCGNRPDAAQRALIENSVEITRGIMAAVRPGSTPREAGIVGDELAAKYGYEDSGAGIWDLYGHGLGMFWAGPQIPAGDARHFRDNAFWNVDEPFHADQVFTVETFFREPGVGTATFEEVFIIQDHGLEQLVQTPLIFW